jgi:hypothetical protein
MNKAIVKTSKVVKQMTSNVRTSFDAFDRARDVYLAQIKRAEADYYDRIKRATAILTGEDTATPETAEETAPIQTDSSPAV